jgi:hypothetical protein
MRRLDAAPSGGSDVVAFSCLPLFRHGGFISSF